MYKDTTPPLSGAVHNSDTLSHPGSYAISTGLHNSHQLLQPAPKLHVTQPRFLLNFDPETTTGKVSIDEKVPIETCNRKKFMRKPPHCPLVCPLTGATMACTWKRNTPVATLECRLRTLLLYACASPSLNATSAQLPALTTHPLLTSPCIGTISFAPPRSAFRCTASRLRPRQVIEIIKHHTRVSETCICVICFHNKDTWLVITMGQKVSYLNP